MADQPFSFASLVKPGEGSTQALKRHLEVARARERRAMRPTWVYGGIADFLSQHGTFFTGRELPDTLEHLRGPMQECHANALEAAEADPSLRYFTGLYMVSGAAADHSWCVDANGGLVEVTLPNAAMRGRTPVTSKTMHGPVAPMLTPPYWAYVGVEFDTAFVRAHKDTRGLPLLDPYENSDGPHLHGCYLRSEEAPMWAQPYTKSGFVVPTVPILCEDCEGWGDDVSRDDDTCQRCGGSGVEP